MPPGPLGEVCWDLPPPLALFPLFLLHFPIQEAFSNQLSGSPTPYPPAQTHPPPAVTVCQCAPIHVFMSIYVFLMCVSLCVCVRIPLSGGGEAASASGLCTSLFQVPRPAVSMEHRSPAVGWGGGSGDTVQLEKVSLGFHKGDKAQEEGPGVGAE